MGLYDIPAVIEHILDKTNQSTMSYVGHSMGCAMFFVAMIKYPELNDKIDVMMALAPATSLANMKSPIQYATPFASIIEVYFLCLAIRSLRDSWTFCRDSLTLDSSPDWKLEYIGTLQAILVLIQIRVFLPNDSLLPSIQRRFCDKNTHNAAFCRNVVFFFAGGDTQNFDLVIQIVVVFFVLFFFLTFFFSCYKFPIPFRYSRRRCRLSMVISLPERRSIQ